MKILFYKLYFILIVCLFFNFCDNNDLASKNNKIKSQTYVVYKNFPSKYVTPRDIEIWLPANYDEVLALPVLYMFDGQNIYHGKKGWINNQYSHGWQVDETLDSLINIGDIPPVMVVGVFNSGIKRFSEYMPAKPKKEIEKRILNQGKWVQEGYRKHGIFSDLFLKFLVKELKPYIDKHYKTKKGRNHTYLAGSSMGGLISAYAICEYPNIFGKAACFSTHWPAFDGVFIQYLKNNLPSPETHKIYFDHGTVGLDSLYEQFQIKVDTLMMRKGYKKGKNWITKKFEGEDHNESFWRKRFHFPIKFFFQDKE